MVMAFQSGARAPSQLMPANGGGGKVVRRSPVPIRPTPVRTAAPVRGTIARPPATTASGARLPFAGNPIAGPLAAQVMQRAGATAVTTPRSGAIVSPTPVRVTAPTVRMPPPPVRPPAIASTPVGGAPARGTLLSSPVPPPPTTGAPVSQSIAIQHYAGVPPAGTPPSMTFGPTQGAVAPADAGGFTLGGPFFSVSGFQMNQGTLLLFVIAGVAILWAMSK